MIHSKAEILKSINATFSSVASFAKQQQEENFQSSSYGKWSAQQHLDHLSQSTAILNKALSKHRLLLRYSFGKPNRNPRTYDQVVSRYNERLKEVSPGTKSPFEGKQVGTQKEAINYFEKEAEKLSKLTAKWKDKHLDNYLLPHPLLGKMTLREILFFTIYHTNHHGKSIDPNSV